MGSLLAFSHFFHRRQNTRREDGTIWEFGYNDRSEVTSAVKQAANSQLVPGQSFAYGFDAMGNRTSTSAGTAPNVASSGYTPNALNQFSSITTPGKLDVLARSDSPASFQIDGQNIAATRVGNLHNAHANVANSPNGKNVSVNVTANGSTQSGSRWLAPASVAPTYDADGNLRQDGRWSYTWDGEKCDLKGSILDGGAAEARRVSHAMPRMTNQNRLTKLQTLTSAITAGAPNLTISYTYDFRSRKLRETLHDGTTLTQDERTLYDGWNPVAEFKFHNSTFILHNSFLWGPDLSGTTQGAGGVGGLLAVRAATPVSGSSVFFPSYDTNGNIIAWSSESGQLIRRLDYDPFGNVVMKETFQGSSAELDQILKHGFSTKPQNPESGLLYYGYRFYDPQLGRWLSRDPIEEEGGVNLYGFVGNDGVNRWDLLGMSKIGDVVDFYDNPEKFLTSKLEGFIKIRIPSYKIYSLASKIGAEMADELNKSLKYQKLIGNLALSVDDLHNLEECIIDFDSKLNLDNATVTALNCCLFMQGHTTKIGYATLQYLKNMFPSLGKGIAKSLLKVGTGKIEARIKKHFDATGYDLSKYPDLNRDVGHFLIEQSMKEIDKIINSR